MTAQATRREAWADVARGVGIVLVVLGHAPTPIARFLYWFHMPLFFLVSGCFFRAPSSWSDLGRQLGRRARQLLVPYVAFWLLITAARLVVGPPLDRGDVVDFVWGGDRLSEPYGTFWFITCLYATQALLGAVCLVVGRPATRALAVAALWALGHVERRRAGPHALLSLENADVALVAVAYYAAGWWGHAAAQRHRRWLPAIGAVSIAASVALAWAHHTGHLSYALDMKRHLYTHPLLDLVVPVVLSTALVAVSVLVARTPLARAAAVVGVESMAIMYLHVVVGERAGEGSVALFVVLGVGVPLALARLWWERSPLLRRVLLGRAP